MVLPRLVHVELLISSIEFLKRRPDGCIVLTGLNLVGRGNIVPHWASVVFCESGLDNGRDVVPSQVLLPIPRTCHACLTHHCCLENSGFSMDTTRISSLHVCQSTRPYTAERNPFPTSAGSSSLYIVLS